MSSHTPFKVLIAGAGVAGLEAAIALRTLAGDRVEITLLAPATEFVYRPLRVREPFSGPVAKRYPLSRVVEDFELAHEKVAVTSVDTESRTVTTSDGRTLPYDALLLATGARFVPHLEHVISIDDHKLDEQLHGLIQDVEGGYAKKLAFVVGSEPTWPLPIYELALFTARRAQDMGFDDMVTIVTPEPRPLAIFGSAASDAVAQELAHHRVETVLSSTCTMTADRKLMVHPREQELPADRIVVTPDLYGIPVAGIPVSDERGFVRVNGHGQLDVSAHVFAAGDLTEFPVKQGGLAAQQAVAAAEAIAAQAGIELEPRPSEPTLHGILLGGREPLYMRARLEDGRPVDSEAGTEPLWQPPSKIDTAYLAPYLETLDTAPQSS